MLIQNRFVGWTSITAKGARSVKPQYLLPISTIMTLLTGDASARSPEQAAITKQLAAYEDARRTGDGVAQANFYSLDADVWLSSNRPHCSIS
jgi:hypothetical protein